MVSREMKEGRYMKTLSDHEYRMLDKKSKKNFIKEWKCHCNECAKEWHYLEKMEKDIEKQMQGESMIGLGMCCNPCAVLATSHGVTNLKQKLAEIKSCPNCKSQNVSKEARYIEKQV
jgi:hypothetical protein